MPLTCGRVGRPKRRDYHDGYRKVPHSYNLPVEWLAWCQGKGPLDAPTLGAPSDTQLPRLQIGNAADPVSNAQAMLGACQVIIDLETYTK